MMRKGKISRNIQKIRLRSEKRRRVCAEMIRKVEYVIGAKECLSNEDEGAERAFRCTATSTLHLSCRSHLETVAIA